MYYVWNANRAKKTSESKQKAFFFTAKSLKTEWNKHILFLFRCQITEKCTFFGSIGIKARKTETLDLCQLSCPLYEIHKMINLPASVKIFKNKLKSWETDKSCFHLPHLRQREIIN